MWYNIGVKEGKDYMKSQEKLEYIEKTINTLNNSVLKNKKWKLGFSNKGTNNYCVVIKDNKQELFCGKFDTYGSAMSCLDLLKFMFDKANNERR